MASHQYSNQIVRDKLMPHLKRCRDREVRTKAELILYALKLQNVTLAYKRHGFRRSFHYKWVNRRTYPHGTSLETMCYEPL